MEEERVYEDAHSIKLTKTTKGYTWEIKIKYGVIDEWKTVTSIIEDLDKHLNEKFGVI